MADRYLLESGAPDGYLLEDGSGVLLLEGGPEEFAGFDGRGRWIQRRRWFELARRLAGYEFEPEFPAAAPEVAEDENDPVQGELVFAAQRLRLRGQRPWLLQRAQHQEPQLLEDLESREPVVGELVFAAQRLRYRSQKNWFIQRTEDVQFTEQGPLDEAGAGFVLSQMVAAARRPRALARAIERATQFEPELREDLEHADFVLTELVFATRRQQFRSRRSLFTRQGQPEEEAVAAAVDWAWAEPVRGELVHASRRLQLRGHQVKYWELLTPVFEPEAPSAVTPRQPKRELGPYYRFRVFQLTGRPVKTPR